ncbi:glycosyltransferase family 4 protein [Novosphingobium sp. AP12]|uniref:glycosyltransferase family 4 protein n=1 Tax=Novosphingobium sp. AP12 TaxID=1144305 RepID=UPI000566F131|nr:glycosyltransferase family 4 protein [Novosphingobium sp. AP12]
MIAVASLGDYRGNVVKALKRRLGDKLTIYAGGPAYSESIRLLDYEQAGVRRLRNYYLKGDVLLQQLPWSALLCAESLILDLNPRVPHVWLITGVRRLLGRRTMLWGHAWPHAGPGARSDRLRGLLRRLASGLVAYTETQAQALRDTLPGRPIQAAPNALYPAHDMRFELTQQRFRILYVGRIVAEKKADLLIEAFVRVADRMSGVVLTIVGDGPERAALMERAQASAVADRIEFPGYISEHERLRPIYAETIVSVSPGYVGLSVTQSLSFGVPMLISRDERHSPEIEAVRPDFNAEFFETNDADALGAGLLRFVEHAHVWRHRGPAIVEDCAARYSVERMAEGLALALTGEQ